MRRLGSAACAAFMLAALPAAADTIASPPIYGGLTQKFMVCYVFNAGTTAIGITATKGYTDLGVVGTLSSTCPASLQPGKTCQMVVSILNDIAHGCLINLSNKANARASVEIRDVNAKVLNRADLR
ncbi:MAG: hypothetical protein U1E14_09100 [Geminicoccaceae bacterium]